MRLLYTVGDRSLPLQWQRGLTLTAAERISLTLRQPPGADKTIQPGHAIIEALNKLGKSRAFMPYGQ